MAVLIKGMDMPKSCRLCKLKTVVGLDKEKCLVSGVEFYLWDTGWGDEQRRHESCPLVPVPEPHGDLIDRDKLRAKEFIHNGDAYAVVMSRDIRNAPTVIPASEEAE